MYKLPLSEGMALFIILLAYILSANSFFVAVGGVEFNPSKLFLLFLMPFLVLLHIKVICFRVVDFVFCVIVILVFTRSVVYLEPKSALNFTNWLVPYCFYKVFQLYGSDKTLLRLIKCILIFWVFHALIGLWQFYSGDYNSLFFDDVQRFKAKYASDFWFNPFGALAVLPHGLYVYSTILAMGLLLPCYLALALREFIGTFTFVFTTIVFVLTTFLTFSRFDILSLMFIPFFAVFCIDKTGVRFKYLIVAFVFLAILVLLYLLTTTDQVGTVSARLISVDLVMFVFSDIEKVWLGLPRVDLFYEETGINVPHNMYFYLIMAFGVPLALLIVAYFWGMFFRFISWNKRLAMRGGDKYFLRLNSFCLIFIFNIFYMRAFTYYVVDGYESLFLIFFMFLLFEMSYKCAVVSTSNYAFVRRGDENSSDIDGLQS